jgi:uroporphyrinogen decarboxylase
LGQTSKELVKGLFEHKNVSNIPFIPWVCSFAAQLEQVSIQAMLSDAGILSRALINAQKLFGYDAIINIFDPSLEAEACGCKIDWTNSEALPKVVSHPLSEGATIEDMGISDLEKRGRLPSVLEATKRMNIIKGKEVAIAGLVTGPLTLAKHWKGDAFIDDLNQGNYEAEDIIEAAGSIGLKLCRAYCELGVDLVVIVEEMLGQLGSDQSQIIALPLRSIWNVTRFYNVHSIVLSKDCNQEQIEPIMDLQPDGVALSGKIDYTKVRDGALERNCCFSRSMPDTLWQETVSRAQDLTSEYLSAKEKGLFISTEWELPYSTNVNNMHAIMRVIRDSRGS